MTDCPPLLAGKHDPAEHGERNSANRRPRGCEAYRCWCKWLRFHVSRESAKLRRGGAGA